MLKGGFMVMARKNNASQMEVELNEAKQEIASANEENTDTEGMIQSEMKNDEIFDRGSESNKLPPMMSLSEKTKIEDQCFNQEELDAQEEKSEKQLKKENNRIKRDMKNRLKELNSTDDKSWEFEEGVSVTLRDGVPCKYHLSLNIVQLSELYSTGRIYYLESIQRGLKHTASKGDIPIINMKNTKSILNACLAGTINGGCIYLNYAKEYDDDLIFEDGSLSGSYPLSIIDGAHRLECAKLWYKAYLHDPTSIKNPNDFYFPVTIENLTHNEAKNIFVELNSLGLSISKTRIAFHDVFNPNNAIAQKVMNNSMLRGKIELISNSLRKSSSSVMTFGTLLKGCSVFSPSTKGEAEQVGLYLCEFWDEIVENFPKVFGNVTLEIKQQEKTKTFAGEVMFINSMFFLAQELQSVQDWKDRLKRLTKDNFLGRDNEIWDCVLREGTKIINTSSTQKYTIKTMLDQVMG